LRPKLADVQVAGAAVGGLIGGVVLGGAAAYFAMRRVHRGDPSLTVPLR
jgi:hypothetical protein